MLLPVLRSFSIAMPMASHCSKILPMEILTLLLGIVLVIFAAYYLVFNGKLNFRPSKASGLAAGILSGTLGGLFALPGIPASIYLINASAEKEEYYAKMQAFLVVCGGYSIAVRTVQHMVSAQSLKYALAAALVVPIGSLLGQKIYQKSSRTG